MKTQKEIKKELKAFKKRRMQILYEIDGKPLDAFEDSLLREELDQNKTAMIILEWVIN